MKSFLAIVLVVCLAGMSQAQNAPTSTLTLQMIQDGAKCLYGIAGISIDTLELAKIYQKGGVSQVSQTFKDLQDRIFALPEKLTTHPQQAVLEAYTLISKAKSLQAELFTYIPKCSKLWANLQNM